MSRFWMIALAGMSLIALGPIAVNADTFSWTDTGTSAGGTVFSASGTLTATSIGNGEYVADSGMGTINGDSLVLEPGVDDGSPQTSPLELFGFDNVLYPTSSSTLDLYGLVFSDTTSGGELNIFCTPASATTCVPGVYTTADEAGTTFSVLNFSSTFTLTDISTPEPSSLTLLLAGFVALLGITWLKKSKKCTVA